MSALSMFSLSIDRRGLARAIAAALSLMAATVVMLTAQVGRAHGASADLIHVANAASSTDYRIYRVTAAGGLTQIYQSNIAFGGIAVNDANGDIAAQSGAVIGLLNSSGQVKRQFYTDGTDSGARPLDPQDCGRVAQDIDWLAPDRIVWSTEYTPQFTLPGWDPNHPDCVNTVKGDGQVAVGAIRNMNPYADSSGTVLVDPPVLGNPDLQGFAYALSVAPDGRILDQNKVFAGADSYNGAAWAYPQAQQADVWGSWNYLDDRVDDVCADASNTPVLLMRTDFVNVDSPSRIFLPTTGQSIDLGAHGNALACSPDTAGEYAVAVADGRILVGGSGGFREVAKVPSGSPTDVDWPRSSAAGGGGGGAGQPSVRVTFPKRNHRYSRASVKRKFKTLRGKLSSAAGVSRVRVSLARRKGKRCQWLSRRKLTRGSCQKPVYLNARGVDSWKVRLSGRQRRALKPGRYTLGVQLQDAGGNEVSGSGTTTLGFSIGR